MERIVIYARASTVAQTEKGSVDIQFQKAMQWMKGSYELARVGYPQRNGCYEDGGVSGLMKASDRPALQALLADARQKRFQRVAVTALDRLGRSIVEIRQVLDELVSYDIKVHLLREGQVADPSSAMGKLMLNMLASFSELELDVLKERMLGARISKMRAEKPTFANNQAPYGYEWDGEKFVVDKEAAETIKFIYQSILKKKSFDWIIKGLNQKGIPTPSGKGRWWTSSISRIVNGDRVGKDLVPRDWYWSGEFPVLRYQTESSAGSKRKIQHRAKDEQIIFPVPPILNGEDVLKARKLSGKRWTNMAHIKHRTRTYELFLLTDLLFCAHCGHKVSAHIGARAMDRYYTCAARRKRATACDDPWISNRDGKFDRGVWAFITYLTWLFPEETLEQWIKEVKNGNGMRELEKQITILTSRETKLMSNHKRLLTLFAEGSINKSLLTEQVAELENEVEAIRERKVELEQELSQLKDKESHIDDLRELAKETGALSSKVIQRMASLSNRDRRQFLLKCFEKLVIPVGKPTKAKFPIEVTGPPEAVEVAKAIESQMRESGLMHIQFDRLEAEFNYREAIKWLWGIASKAMLISEHTS